MANKDLHYIITLLAIGPSAKFSENCVFAVTLKLAIKVRYTTQRAVFVVHIYEITMAWI